MSTLGTIIEHDVPLINYAQQYIAGLSKNLKLQIKAIFNAHIGPQVMTRAVQTRNLNDVVSAMVRIEKNNTATLALIDQRQSGITNFLTRFIDPSPISPGPSNSTAVGSLISGLATPEARTIASLTEQFLGGGATAGGKSQTCWGCLKPECPGWYSNTQKKVVCPMANDPFVRF